MKFNFKALSVLWVVPALMVQMGCGDAQPTSYYISNGVCMANTGQQVDMGYCNSSTSGGYYLGSDGQCRSSQTQQIVLYQYCQNNQNLYPTNTGGYYLGSDGQCRSSYNQQIVPYTYCQGTTGGQQCSGLYYYPANASQVVAITCGTMGLGAVSCSGMTLYTASGQTVYCQ